MNNDPELIADFLGEYADAQYEIEKIIGHWETSKGQCDGSSVNALFGSVHSIKSNLRMMELNPLSDTIHRLEDLLTQLRDQQCTFVPGFSLLISSTLEQCKQLAKQTLRGDDKAQITNTLSLALSDLNEVSTDQFAQKLVQTLQIIDHHGEYGSDYSSQALFDFLQQAEQQIAIDNITPTTNKNTELEYFHKLITQIESYFPFWRNRSNRILDLVSQMNEMLDCPVNPEQLQAAVYLHDIGMSFIPPQKIYSARSLASDDRELMQSHCEMGYQWLNMISDWEDAALMVLQHHERYDGTGYPAALSGNQICDGAKLLTIGDTFVSITNLEKKAEQKKSLMFALMEINQAAEQQFDPKWVAVFNQVIETFTDAE